MPLPRSLLKQELQPLQNVQIAASHCSKIFFGISETFCGPINSLMHRTPRERTDDLTDSRILEEIFP